MGDRGQVKIEDTGVYLYTHWGAYRLQNTLQDALKKKWRWDDVEYLTRIIFDEMIGEHHGEETGFGISDFVHEDLNEPLITVNCEHQTVEIGETTHSFDEFINLKLKENN